MTELLLALTLKLKLLIRCCRRQFEMPEEEEATAEDAGALRFRRLGVAPACLGDGERPAMGS